MVRKTITEELMKEKWLRILKLFLNNQRKEYTLKEVEDETGASYKTVKKVVDILEDYGFLDTQRKGNYRMVTVNQGSPYIGVFESLGDIDARPLEDAAQEFAEELKKRFPDEISSTILFGSVARGMPTSESDIDVLVLVEDERKKEEVNDEAWSLRDRYQREKGVNLSPLVFTRKEFKREARNQGPLETRIIEEGKPLIGEIPDAE